MYLYIIRFFPCEYSFSLTFSWVTNGPGKQSKWDIAVSTLNLPCTCLRPQILLPWPDG